MSIAFHLTPARYFESGDAERDYMPADYARDGFIHCTDGAGEMARIANLFYRGEPGGHLYLYIDKERVRAPWRYDDPEHKYPHIYGPLNRDAIVAVRAARRDEAGNFLPPEELE